MPIPGTDSTAIQNPDGTWDVLDVPIVHEGTIPRYDGSGAHVDDFPITTEWMSASIVKARQREAEGYMGRSFVDHHESGPASQPDAGFVRPTRVGTVISDGQTLPALFANLVGIPNEEYQAYVKTGRVPYRSVESLHAESCFIDGLALMPTRSPHFKLPMLTIGTEQPYGSVPGGTRPGSVERVGAVACASAGHAKTARTRYGSPAMTKPKKPALKAQDDEPEKKKPDGDEPEAKAGKLSEIDLDSAEGTLEEWLALLASVQEKVEGMKPGEPNADTEVVEQPQPMGAAGKSKASVGYNPALEARLIAAEARIDEYDAEKERDALLTAADKTLRTKNLGSDRKATLRAQFDKGGASGLAGFVEAYKQMPDTETGDPDDVPGMTALSSDLPEEVEEYTNPTDRRVAMQAAARFNEQKAGGFPMGDRSLKATIARDVLRARSAAS